MVIEFETKIARYCLEKVVRHVDAAVLPLYLGELWVERLLHRLVERHDADAEHLEFVRMRRLEELFEVPDTRCLGVAARVLTLRLTFMLTLVLELTFALLVERRARDFLVRPERLSAVFKDREHLLENSLRLETKLLDTLAVLRLPALDVLVHGALRNRAAIQPLELQILVD